MSETHHTDPHVDERANYDYEGGRLEQPKLAAALEKRVEGEVRFDSFTRQSYATDGSVYEVLPIGVVFPESKADVLAVVEYCHENDIPVLPRGGGTSLAGQAVNEAVILDFKRHMNDVIRIDPDERVARVQAGLVLDRFDNELAPYDLQYAPKPSPSDRTTIGGAIGNNTTGSRSLKYGMTHDKVEEVEVVFADGTEATLGEVAVSELAAMGDPEGNAEERFYAEVNRILEEEAEAIEDAFPAIQRNVSGYNLDVIVEEAEDGTVNLARLMVGSEGTLAVVVEALVSLEGVPAKQPLALLTYKDLVSAMRDVGPILEHDPSAVEILDDTLLELARDLDAFKDTVAILPEGTKTFLLVEFFADTESEAHEKTEALLEDRVGDIAFDGLEAHDPARQKEFWKMRKASTPILLSRTTDEKHIAFVEDVAIPPEHLPEYIEDFQDVFEENGTFGSFYAHAGPGCLHVRPLVNTKTGAGIEMMEAISEGAAELAVKYGGSVSGEHGDGRARTQWNRRLYGDHVWDVFRSLKRAVDPDWRMNPGPVCGYDNGDPTDLTDDLRFDPDYEFEVPFEPALNWDIDNGFQGMTELCHGCGACTGYQDTSGGVMCPSYRAADEEITSTRGRANMLRAAMDGDLPDDLLSEEFIHEVLDLCMSCKGCKIDCPSGVDMAKLKAEVEWEYKQREGVSLRDKLFANVEDLLKLGSTFSPLSNWAMDLPGSKTIQEQGLGIARERDLPAFKSTTLQQWFRQRGGSSVPRSAAERKAVFVADPYTNHMYTERGKAAIEVLEAAGVHVEVSDEVTDSGRPAFSKGLIGPARETATENVDALAPKVQDGWDIVSVEPSSSVMIQEDYLDLLRGRDVEAVAANTYSVFEYLDAFGLDEGLDVQAAGESLTYHGNCMHKGTKREHYVTLVMNRLGFEVDQLDSTCCGMAGSFGYEKEHYSMSKSLMNLLESQIADSPGDDVVVTGASCTMQVGDMPSQAEKPDHAIQRLAYALQ